MVWVLTGQVMSLEGGPVNEDPPTTSHWLRPDRMYQLGRGMFEWKPNKFTLKKLYDFRVNNLSVSTSAHFRLQLGEWTSDNVADHPELDANLEPYSLTLVSDDKVMNVTRVGEEEEQFVKSTPISLASGDIVRYSKNLSFKVEWIPYILCLASRITETQTSHAQELGIKLASKNFLPHHTHFLPSKLSPTISLCLAALSQASVVHPDFLIAFRGAASLPPRPDGLPDPPAPGETLSKPDEKQVTELNPDAGADWVKWWGHSMLEADWEATWADPNMRDDHYPIPGGEGYEAYTSADWGPNPARNGLFKDVLVVSFRGSDHPADAIDRKLVEGGQGHFFNTDLAEKNAATRTILQAIAAFRQEANVSEEARVAVIPYADCQWSSTRGEPPAALIMRQVAVSLGVHGYIATTEITAAIHSADSASLFDSTPTGSQSQGAMLLAPPSAAPSAHGSMMPSSFVSVAGTHPEEESIHPPRRGGPAPRAAAAAAAAEYDEEEMPEVAPTPTARKLTRRAKSGMPTSTLDSLFGGARTQPAESRAAFSLEETNEAQMDQDAVASMSASAANLDVDEEPSRPRLKRRAGGAASQELSSSAAEPPAKKQRGNESSKGDLSTVAEETDDGDPTPGPSTTSKKRGQSVVEGQDDEPPRAAKKTRGTSQVPEDPPAVASKTEVAAKKKTAPTPTKGKAAAGKKGAKGKEKDAEAEAAEERILRMKTIKRKGGELDQEFNDEFNALRIVRPALTKMPVQKGVRINWDDEDVEDELERMIHEDQERLERPEENGIKGGGGMFQVHHMKMLRSNRPAPRDDLELEEKYAGRPNFKKFRPKNSTKSFDGAVRASRARPVLVVSENADFGLGGAYDSTAKTKAKKQVKDDFDNDDGTQTKLKFGAGKAKAKPVSKGKGKAKAIVSDEEEEEDVFKLDDEMDVDENGSGSSSMTATLPASSTAESKKAPPKKAPPKKAPARKAAPTTLVIDSDSDSDDGVTFRGFGKTQTGQKRKR